MTDKDAPVALGNDDFDAIQGAVMETARGRWFLAEFAKRNKAADTDKVLEAVERLEGLMQNGRIVTGPDMLQAELVTLTARIAQAKMEIVAHANSAKNQDDMVKIAVRALHRVEGRVSGIAEDLRRSTTELEDPKVAAQFLLGAQAFVQDGVARLEPQMPSQSEQQRSVQAPKTSEVPLPIMDVEPADASTETDMRVAAEDSLEKPVAISAARLSALEELANRALQMKKAHADAQAAKKVPAEPHEQKTPAAAADKPTAMPNVPAHADIPPRNAPLMKPPAPVNDDAHLVTAENAIDTDALFSPDWVVRTTTEEREEFEMPVPQVAVAGQARSSSMLARSAPVPTSFFASERTIERAAVTGSTAALSSVGERRSPFATLAAASKALRATQALVDKQESVEKNDVSQQERASGTAAKYDEKSDASRISSELNTAGDYIRKERMNRQWENVFAAPSAEAGRSSGLDAHNQTESRAAAVEAGVNTPVLTGELPTLSPREHSSLAASPAAVRSGNPVSIRAIDALSFEEKSVYFS